jgi:hypothetical protein
MATTVRVCGTLCEGRDAQRRVRKWCPCDSSPLRNYGSVRGVSERVDRRRGVEVWRLLLGWTQLTLPAARLQLRRG